ncbi:MAG: peptide-methionine (S)-S-oxide reductase MsrA [Flavobacteriaceae bacterium]
MNLKDITIATFAGGCFWCTEAVFQRLKGVEKVVSGYTGGTIKNPAYREICTGRTGHAEAIQVYFNPGEIQYKELLEVFFATHDPTTLNRQGNDRGTQYRSAVFYNDEKQKEIAEEYIKSLEDKGVFENPIVTEITEATVFYPAEGEHQDYYNQNENQLYCQLVISPKVQKLNNYFKDKLNE